MRKINLLVIAFAILIYACGGNESKPSTQEGQSSSDSTRFGQLGAPEGKDVSVSDDDKMLALQDSNYLVPSPAEILNALNRLENIEWYKIVTYNEQTNYKDKASRALNLGVRIADSFVAINDKDKDNFGKMSAAIFELGDALMIKDILLDNRDKLEELANGDEWKKMTTSIDEVQNEIQEAIKAKGEDDLVALASVAGWLEGLRIVSTHLSNNYSADKTELLNQADLIQYYQRSIASVKNDTPIVKEVQASIDKIEAILKKTNNKGAQLSQADVKTLQTISQDIVNAIVEG